MTDQNKKETKSPDTTQGVLRKLVLISFCMSMFFLLFYFDNGVLKFLKFTIWLFPYAALLILLSIFTKYRVIHLIHSILWVPGSLILLTGPVIHVIGSLVFAYLIIFGMSIIAVIYSQNWFNYKLEFASGVYLVLTLSSIAATLFSEKLIKSWHYAQNREYKDQVEKYSLLLFGQQKVRYLIFLVYFLLLIIFTFSSLNHIEIIKAKGVDIAILQSFATFVSYDRLISNWDSFIASKKN